MKKSKEFWEGKRMGVGNVDKIKWNNIIIIVFIDRGKWMDKYSIFPDKYTIRENIYIIINIFSKELYFHGRKLVYQIDRPIF